MNPSPPLVESLRAQRLSLIEEVVEAVPPAAPFFAGLPRDACAAVAARVIDLTLDAMVDHRPEAVRAFALETYERRREQGAPLGDILRALQIIRRILAGRVWKSGAALGEAGAVVDRVNDVLDELAGVAAAVFERRFDAISTDVKAVEARYREAYVRAPAMMLEIDSRGRVHAVSDHWLVVLGYSRDDVVGRGLAELLTEESRRQAMEVDGPRLRAQGELWDVPYQLVKKTGEVIDVLLSARAVQSGPGEEVNALAVLVDVTEKLRIKKALKDSELRWRTLFEGAPLPLLVQEGGYITSANNAMVQLLRASSCEQVVGRSTLDFTHPDDRAIVEERRARVRSSNEPLPRVEVRIVRCDGTASHVEAISRVIARDGPPAVQVALVDLEERKEAEEVRRRSEVQAQVIAAQAEMLRVLTTPLIPLGDGVVVMPLVGRITVERAAALVERLAAGVVEQAARVAIVDVTGVPEADAGVAEALVRAARAVRLLGADVVLTGIQPSIAQALVARGVDLGGIATRGTLRDSLHYAYSMGVGWSAPRAPASSPRPARPGLAAKRRR